MVSPIDPSSLRIIDACANRASEALRVAEDVLRFHWQLGAFAGQLKLLRHDLLGILERAFGPQAARARARDLGSDPGAGVGSPSSPRNADEVAFRNLQRAKESLRSLEELSRVCSAQATAELEALRFRAYAIEQAVSWLSIRSRRSRRSSGARLCLLATSSLSRRPLLEAVAEAITAGVDMVQMREKGLSDRERLRLGLQLRELTAARGVPFIVNDRPDLARLLAADGVHLGQEDLPIAAARRVLDGQDLLIGLSTHSMAQARLAWQEGADYIGVGPMYPTATKDAGPTLGPEGLGPIAREAPVPVFAIGGIQPERVPSLRAAGASRIAVSSAILAAEDVAGAVGALLKELGPVSAPAEDPPAR